MFATFGPEADFADWVVRLGGQSTPAAPTKRGGWAGAELVYLQAARSSNRPDRPSSARQWRLLDVMAP
jgi:hypothetical protein